MAFDASLNISADYSDLSAVLKRVESDVLRAFAQIERKVSAQLKGASQATAALSNQAAAAAINVNSVAVASTAAAAQLAMLQSETSAAAVAMSDSAAESERFAASVADNDAELRSYASTITRVLAPLSRLAGSLLVADGVASAFALSFGGRAVRAADDFAAAQKRLAALLGDNDALLRDFSSQAATTAGAVGLEPVELLEGIISRYQPLLKSLQSDSQLVQGALAGLGVAQTDSNDALRSGADIYQDVIFILARLDAAQRQYVAGQLVGAEAAQDLLAGLNGVGGVLTNQAARLTSLGLASEATAGSLNQLTLAVGQRLKTAIDGNQQALGRLGAALTGAVQGNTFDAFLGQLQVRLDGVAVSFNNFAGVLPGALNQLDLQPVINGIDAVYGRLLNLAPTTEQVAIALNLASRAAGGFLQVLGGVDTVVKGTLLGIGLLVDQFAALSPVTQRWLGLVAGGAFVLRTFGSAVTSLALGVAALVGADAVFSNLFSSVAAAPGAASALSQLAGDNGIAGLVESVLALSGLQSGLDIGGIAATAAGLATEFKNGFMAEFDGIESVFAGVFENLATQLAPLSGQITPLIGQLGQLSAAGINAIGEAFAGLDITPVVSQIQGVITALGALTLDDINAAFDKFTRVMGLVVDAGVGFVNFITGAASGVSALLIAFGQLEPLTQQLIGAFAGVVFLLAPVLTGLAALVIIGVNLSTIFAVVAGALGGVTGAIGLVVSRLGTLAAGFLTPFNLAAAAVGGLAFAITKLSGLDKILNDIFAPDWLFGEGATIGTVAGDFADWLGTIEINLFSAANAAEVATVAINKQVAAQRSANDIAADSAANGAAAAANVQALAAAEAARAEQAQQSEALITQLQTARGEKEADLIRLRSALEEQAAQKSAQFARDYLELTIDARRRELAAARRTLGTLRTEEQKLTRLIQQEQLARENITAQTETRINQIRLRGLSGLRQRRELQSQISSAEAAALRVALGLATIRDDIERRAAVTEGQRQIRIAQGLAQQIGSNFQAEQLLRSLGGTEDFLLKKSIEANKGAAESRAESVNKQQSSIGELELAIEDLQTRLDNFGKEPKEAKIKVEIDAAIKAIDEVEKRLALLSKGVTVPVRVLQTVGEADAPQVLERFNRGAIPVPGYGNYDSVHALLTPGEVVIDKWGNNLAAAIAYFSKRNRGASIPAAVGPGVPGYANGAVPVPAGQNFGNITISMGPRVETIPTTLDGANALRALLSELGVINVDS